MTETGAVTGESERVRLDVPTILGSFLAVLMAITGVCVLAGMRVGAAFERSNSVLAPDPIDGVRHVDDALVEASWSGPLEHALAAVWPVVEIPLVVGARIGVAVPEAGTYGFSLVCVAITAWAAVRIRRNLEGDDDG